MSDTEANRPMLSELAFDQFLVEAEGAQIEVFVARAAGPLMCTTHPFIPTGGNTVETLNTSAYIRALAAAGQLVVVNPRGMGNSSAVERADDLTLRRLADDLEAVRRELGSGRWIVAGGSSGAHVALLYALAYQNALRGLLVFTTGAAGTELLENPEALGSPSHPQHANVSESAPLRTEPSGLGRAGAEWRQLRADLWCYCEDGVPKLMLPRHAEAPPPARHRAALEEFASLDVAVELSQIQTPTLVVCGRRDELIPLRECERVAAIPGAELVVLGESGHGLDEMDAFQAAVRRFVAARD